MGNIKQTIETTETKDIFGRVTGSESVISPVSIARSTEPDYVKR